MNQRRSVMITMGLVLALVLGYMFGGQQKDGQVTTIESYSVPTERAEEIRVALWKLFPSPKDGISEGSVQVVSGNTLVVRSTREIQKGVRQFIHDYIAQKPAITPVRLEYWLIGAKNGPAVEKNYGELESVVESLKKVQSDKNFEVIEHSDISTISNERAESRSGDGSTEIKVQPIFANEKIIASMEVDGKYGKLVSNVRLNPGEFVVLGQNSYNDHGRFLGGKDEKLPGPINVYHVVRATVIR